MGIPERIIWWVAALIAVLFGVAFLYGAGRAFNIIDPPPRPSPMVIPQAAATPSYSPPSGSRCSPAIDGAPYEWTAIVCPAADQLSAARKDFDALVKDSDGGDWIAAYADAALLSQQLETLKLSFEHAPTWKRGASVVTAVTAALDSYRDGVASLNTAAQMHDKKLVANGKKLIAAGHKSLASAVKGLKALASPPPSASAVPSASVRAAASQAPRASAAASAAP